MDKNTRLAIILVSLFIVVWYMGILPKITPPAPPQPDVAVNPQKAEPRPTPPLPVKEERSEKTAVLAWKDTSATFSTHSAGLKSVFVRTKTGQVDLVPESVQNPLPLGTFPELAYNLRLPEKGEAKSVIFFAQSQEGWTVEKKFSIQQETQVQKLELRFSNPTKTPVKVPQWFLGWGPGLSAGHTVSQKDNLADTRVIAFRKEGKGGFLDKYKKTGSYPLAHQWVAIDNRYFLAALFLPEGEFPFVDVDHPKGVPSSFRLKHLEFLLDPGAKKEIIISLYLGPKGYTHLKGLNLHLERSIDFGFFGFLGEWTLYSLYFFNKIIGNYGWAIVLLTMALQVLVFPLTRKSFKAAQDMKRIQPQMKVIQEKFKGDPKRLQQEMMGLYKKAGVNPFGGCLPMLPQIPIFWALFTTLRNAFELQGAPWIFWIKDLSSHDPYYVLPVLMGLGMFAQQKATMVQTDPTQAKMAYIMPIMLTFMFLKFPAGVAVYMVTNSAFTLITQLIMKKSHQGA